MTQHKGNLCRTRVPEVYRLLSPCRLCPRACGVDRVGGQRGYCGAGPIPEVASIVPHFGEEPPLVVNGGAGTVFFSRCNLRCMYCQNFQISQGNIGSPIHPEALATAMLHLQEQGCANIEFVSPNHHLPGLLEALSIAFDRGLDLPIVYNTNGYEAPDILDLLEGVIDVYLPDLKYASEKLAGRYSDASEYPRVAREAILKMYAQVGDLQLDSDGRAIRGMILRHLILPGDISGTRETLTWIRDSLPRSVTVSLLAQYAPLHRAYEDLHLSRKITQEEYDRVLDLAWDMGLENAFIQDLDSQDMGIPDFRAEKPFIWND
ncbi:radical SAM protein [Desulfomonile tiedjei]|uniref:radical SAM protein n=1 Tax=Desulfomonile tiedjei TaxID=2358 RepID=UPI0012F9C2B5|nr:radical SAM protein [Desulfomonile tiedjei]